MIRLDAIEYSCKTCKTSDCFIKKYCDDTCIKLISEKKETAIYREHQYIVQEGNAVRGLYFIQKGCAKIISSGLGGKNQVVRLTKEGDIIGHRGYGNEKYPISAVAIKESVVCLIDNDTIYDVFMKNPELTYALMMYYSIELRKSEAKIKAQAQMNVREKVAEAVLYCNSVFNNNEFAPFILEMNRQDLSNLAGINTEQLSRILSEFKRENIIKVHKNQISVIDVSRIKEMISPFGIV